MEALYGSVATCQEPIRPHVNTFLGEIVYQHTHVNTDGKAIGIDLLSSLNVDVLGSCRRCRVEARVVRREFAPER